MKKSRASKVPNPWTIDLSEWREANSDTLTFMLERAELRLGHTVDQDRTIRDRAFTYISILVPVVAVLLGYIAGKSPEFMEAWAENWKTLLVIGFLPILFALVLLGWAVYPRVLFSQGRTPKELYNPRFLVGPLSKEEQSLSLLLSSLEKLEREIAHNDAMNAPRVQCLQVVIWLMGTWLCAMLTALLIR